jgi:hypothetical protein
MIELLQGQVSGGKSHDELDKQHVSMIHVIKCQSKRDFPLGAVQSNLIESTLCHPSEWKGILFS